jgi:hypothetical protein
MMLRTLLGLAGCGALLVTSSANAVFFGLSTQAYNTVINGNARTVWRVYADFTSPTEGIATFGSIQTDMTLETFAGAPNAPVSGDFFAGGNPVPPTQEEIDFNPGAAHRSFYTINLTTQDQNPNPAAFPLFNLGMPALTGNSVTAPLGGSATTTTPDAPFALASWNGPNAPYRVLLMQLQVTAGNHVRGTLGVFTLGAEAVVVTNFNSAIPAPSTLALLGVVGAIGSRRRRT